MNGYFQIVSLNGKCGIKFVPPTPGGEPVRREELLEYLNLKNITYDPKLLGPAFSEPFKPAIVPTITDFRFPEGEFVKVSIAQDNMSVTVRIIPPYDGGPKMAKNEFMREFSARGISYGIDEVAVDKFLENRQYCTDAVLVKGTQPVQGEDARIEYYFNTDPHARPTLKEDGSVDFFQLNTVNSVTEGQLLAKLFPAKKGEPGYNVKGEKISPREVKYAQLKFGHNIELSEDKTEIKTLVSGHVNLVEGKVFVSNVLEVENVDPATGNIDYEGCVQINGNVCQNYVVKAKGNITVKGVVEGAKLEAGGDIVIARGMNGMGKGELKAGGNIISKFIENSKCDADGYIESESIMHSTVNAGTDIRVVGKHGFISGGHATASQVIEVKNLGSNMGADTIVEVGTNAQAKKRIQELQVEIKEINKQLATIKPVLDGARQKLQLGIKMSTDQLLQLQKIAQLNKAFDEKLAASTKELEELGGIKASDAGQVVVTGDVYPGTKICIGDVSMVVKNSVKYCRFIKQAGDVKMVAIY